MSVETDKSWRQPVGYIFGSDTELGEFTDDTGVRKVIDPIDQIADDLFEVTHPEALSDTAKRLAFKAQLLEYGVAYGTWFHDEEDNTLTRFAPQEDHYFMRTSRHRDLIRTPEQKKLGDKRIAAIGLSVGSSAVRIAVQAGIGNHYMLFDPDTLSVANLNRLDADYREVGDPKTTVAGRRISRLDPYIKQSHFPEGYTTATDKALRALRPDIIIEEVDDMRAKVAVRNTAAELGIPVVMAGDVGDRTVLTVDRYDRGPMELFDGLISPEDAERLLYGGMTDAEQQTALIKLIGSRNISLRLLDSVPKIGQKNGIAGIPQLGATAAVGGAVVANTVRDILLDRGVPSGRRSLDMRDIIGSGRTTHVTEAVQILKRFAKYRAEQRKKTSER